LPIFTPATSAASMAFTLSRRVAMTASQEHPNRVDRATDVPGH
jgi:hypothetical protein